jgi:hypothetical protein
MFTAYDSFSFFLEISIIFGGVNMKELVSSDIRNHSPDILNENPSHLENNRFPGRGAREETFKQ